jgi:hypothetical protein
VFVCVLCVGVGVGAGGVCVCVFNVWVHLACDAAAGLAVSSWYSSSTSLATVMCVSS